MWGMKTETISVVIGTVGLIKKGLQKSKKKSLGINMNELQKITIMNSPHTKVDFVLKANFISSVVP